MQFESIILQNFMSFEEVATSFGESDLVLIRGDNQDEGDSNGSGKSSLFDGISWALFGETIRGVTGDAVINRLTGEDCFVSIRISIGGSTYIVDRHRKDTKTDSDGKPWGDRFMFFKDGKTVELGTIAATQAELLTELGVDFELFRCTVLFGQEDTFNFVSATDKKQKEILSKVKRLNFEPSLKSVRTSLKETEEEIGKIDTDLEVLKSHRVEDPAAEFAKDIEFWNMNQSARIKAKKAEIKEHEAEIVKLEAEILDVGKANEVIDKIIKIGNGVKDERSALRGKSDITERKIGFFKGRLKELTDLSEKSDCPVCQQKITKATLSQHTKETKDSLELLLVARGKIVEEIEALDEKIEEMRGKEDRVRAKIVGQRQVTSGIALMKVNIVKANNQIAALKAEDNPFLTKIEEAKAKQAKIEAAIVKNGKRQAQLHADLPYLAFWEKGFSDKGMKSFVFDSLCSTLTARANHYLDILSDSFLSITFDTQTKLKSGETRERFECAVMANGEKVPYESYSGGEKTRISLAVDMALSDLMSDSYSTKFNIVVFDERDQFLDAKGREYYLNLLRERAKTQSVFVVSHDSELKSRFPTVWTVQKRGGVSSLAC